MLPLVILSFILFPESSDIRWAVLILFLLVFGAITFVSLYRAGAPVPPLNPPAEAEVRVQGELGRLAESLGRAERGMRFSQVTVARRVRRAFLARLQSSRGLSEEELAALLASPRDLERVVGDPLIHAFLEDTAPPDEELLRPQTLGRSSNFRFAQEAGFSGGMLRLLAAMEAWG